MTKKTIFPVQVKVLHVTHTPLGYTPKEYRVEVRKVLHIGKYYVAEHSKTPGLNKGEKCKDTLYKLLSTWKKICYC